MKYKSLFPYAICVGVVLRFVLWGVAQAQVQEPPERRVSFRIMSWNGSIENLYYMEKPDKEAPVSVSSFSRSKYYRFTSSGPLVFFTKTVDAEGNPVRVPQVSVPLNHLEERSLVMLFKDNEGGYRAVVLRDDLSDFKGGHYNFVNLTTSAVAVRCGTKEGVVPSLKNLVLDAKPEEGNASGVAVYIRNEDTLRAVYSNAFAYYDEMRVLVFIFQPPEFSDGRFVVKRLMESQKVAEAVPTVEPEQE